jgi:hypothetical protein
LAPDRRILPRTDEFGRGPGVFDRGPDVLTPDPTFLTPDLAFFAQDPMFLAQDPMFCRRVEVFGRRRRVFGAAAPYFWRQPRVFDGCAVFMAPGSWFFRLHLPDDAVLFHL